MSNPLKKNVMFFSFCKHLVKINSNCGPNIGEISIID